jgi:magnesium chelatase accessory protein
MTGWRALLTSSADPDKPDWHREGNYWPNRTDSQFIQAANITWHVQCAGQGPVVLLIHGTAAATHSWRHVLPLLRDHFTVIAPDLPGHGFTQTPAALHQLSLVGMAESLSALLTALDSKPEIVIGHSAGAAILATMCLNNTIKPRHLVSLCGALLPLRGFPGPFFSPLARLLARIQFFSRVVAYDAQRPGAVERLLAGTGSQIDDEGVALYRCLIQRSGHVAAALQMMSHWDLKFLRHNLHQLTTQLLLVAAEYDKTVPPTQALSAQTLVPHARTHMIYQRGHLAHEEDAAQVAKLIHSLT